MKTFSNTPAAAVAELQRYSLHGQTMGTQYSAVFFTAMKVDTAVINAQLFAAVDTVDRQMSNWKPDSALNRLNDAPENAWWSIPQELFEVLETALLVSKQSQGAFDIGVGDLVHAWGFGPSKGLQNEGQIAALKAQAQQAATQVLEMDPGRCRVRKLAPITLDLAGIAKGYGVDRLAHCLDSLGITRYLVGIDGEMRARGTKPEAQAWAIAIEMPRRHVREVMAVMELSDAAIATSGDYRNWVEHQGKSYSHTMNGALGEPVSNRLAAVSVLAASCMLADAWATALTVLGETAGIALAQARGMEALFVLHDGDEFRQIFVTNQDKTLS